MCRIACLYAVVAGLVFALMPTTSQRCDIEG